jgi:4-aminobutyrate aminotransferase
MKAPNVSVRPQTNPRVRETLEKIRRYTNPASGFRYLAESEWPIIWERGEGATITDSVGNVYIDLDCYAVNLLGHANPFVIDAIVEQAKKLIHAKSRCLTPLQGEIAETLVKLAQEDPRSEGLNQVQFSVTGSNAVEFSMKLAMKYTGRRRFIAFHGAFHGDSQGASAITCGKRVTSLITSTTFVPYAYCYRCPFGKEYPECDIWCVRYLEYLFNDAATGLKNEDIAAIVIEPVQASYGCVVPPDEFIPGVRKVCDMNDILLIDDDIQTGFRLGKYFGITHWTKPDMILIGKNLGGGLPLSATLASERIFGTGAVPTDPFHTETFMSNTLCHAASLAFLQYLKKENIIEHERRLGNYFLKALKNVIGKRNLVGDIRGKGLMLGVELVRDKGTKEPAGKEAMKICQKLPSKGLIVEMAGHWHNNVLKLTPPAVITEEQIDRAVEILDETIKECE